MNFEVCNICNGPYRDKKELDEHSKSHSIKRDSLKCEKCEKTFKKQKYKIKILQLNTFGFWWIVSWLLNSDWQTNLFEIIFIIILWVLKICSNKKKVLLCT